MEETADPTLLVVDDDRALREALATGFRVKGYAVTVASDAASAELRAKEQSFEFALVDVRMPGQSGIELVRTLRSIDDGTRIVVFTGYGSIANAVDAIKAGAVDYLTKPVDVAACERALQGRAADPIETPVPSLDRVEWEYLQRVVSDAGGNISDAARRLGMHRRTLQRKLSRHAPRK